MSQLLRSISSAPSALAAPAIFDKNHVISSSMKPRGTVLGPYSYYLKAAPMGLFMGGNCVSD